VAFDFARAHLRVGVEFGVFEAPELNRARGVDTPANGRRVFARLFAGELLIAQSRDFNLDVDGRAAARILGSDTAESAAACRCIPFADRLKIRRCTAALPFCHRVLRGQKPQSPKYPNELKSLGDHIRRRRLDLGLLQRQVAQQIGVDETTVYNWERNATSPSVRHFPAITQFLGYKSSPHNAIPEAFGAS